jgi:hypothetical protein
MSQAPQEEVVVFKFEKTLSLSRKAVLRQPLAQVYDLNIPLKMTGNLTNMSIRWHVC